jgi:GT2 family glycosyltransferase
MARGIRLYQLNKNYMEFADKEKESLDCAIIILSYNTKEVTDECLAKAEIAVRHVEESLKNRVHIIVVENGSKDGSAEMIRKKHPGVHLICLEENVGYSRGNNTALKKVTTPFILLLNSDAYLREETLTKSIQYMNKCSFCDILSARLVYPDGSFQAFSGFLPTPFRTIRWSFLIESIPIIKNMIKPLYQYKKSFYTKARVLDWATTGFFFMRKDVYDKTGGFDETLFLYMEDVEWCQRIKNNNFKICYSPAIDIVHLGGFTTKKLPSKELLQRHIEGVKHFYSVHYPGSMQLVMACLMLGMIIRAIVYTISFQQKKAKPYWNVIGLLK